MRTALTLAYRAATIHLMPTPSLFYKITPPTWSQPGRSYYIFPSCSIISIPVLYPPCFIVMLYFHQYATGFILLSVYTHNSPKCWRYEHVLNKIAQSALILSWISKLTLGRKELQYFKMPVATLQYKFTGTWLLIMNGRVQI